MFEMIVSDGRSAQFEKKTQMCSEQVTKFLNNAHIVVLECKMETAVLESSCRGCNDCQQALAKRLWNW